ncbi:MAG: hypothetical protein R8G33_03445 [Gammaproteobacteria bacterium]|nr:hypothetical protein [Gammaproteobacteria bacterium]
MSWQKRWKDYDEGLIICWENGKELRKKKPELAKKAKNGELPKLVWKGGVDEETKASKKYGSLKYLAVWQGLRGDDLNIDLDEEPELVCSKTKTMVIFTNDIKKLW